MTTLDKLIAAVSAVAPGFDVAVLRPERAAEDGWDVTTRADGLRVRVDFAATATNQQRAAARAAVLACDLSVTESDRLDGAAVPPRVLAALLLRASASWGGLSAARKQRIQQIIDDAAADAVSRLA